MNLYELANQAASFPGITSGSDANVLRGAAKSALYTAHYMLGSSENDKEEAAYWFNSMISWLRLLSHGMHDKLRDGVAHR